MPSEKATVMLGWAKAWAPWFPETEAVALAGRVAQESVKYTADVLAWRLRLSAAERSALRITTIGAFDMSKADRLEQRKLKDRDRKRAQRAENSTGRPRGRPRKNASAAVRAIAADAFSDQVASVPSSSKSAPILGVTKPPADASGTPIPIDRVGRVDGEAIVGNSSRQPFKTRFPTAMRMDKGMAHYGLSAAFERREVINMFETFRNWNVAMGSYSLDWRQAWFTWVDRQVEYDTERYDRERRQAYYTREVQA